MSCAVYYCVSKQIHGRMYSIECESIKAMCLWCDRAECVRGIGVPNMANKEIVMVMIRRDSLVGRI